MVIGNTAFNFEVLVRFPLLFLSLWTLFSLTDVSISYCGKNSGCLPLEWLIQIYFTSLQFQSVNRIFKTLVLINNFIGVLKHKFISSTLSFLDFLASWEICLLPTKWLLSELGLTSRKSQFYNALFTLVTASYPRCHRQTEFVFNGLPPSPMWRRIISKILICFKGCNRTKFL